MKRILISKKMNCDLVATKIILLEGIINMVTIPMIFISPNLVLDVFWPDDDITQSSCDLVRWFSCLGFSFSWLLLISLKEKGKLQQQVLTAFLIADTIYVPLVTYSLLYTLNYNTLINVIWSYSLMLSRIVLLV